MAITSSTELQASASIWPLWPMIVAATRHSDSLASAKACSRVAVTKGVRPSKILSIRLQSVTCRHRLLVDVVSANALHTALTP